MFFIARLNREQDGYRAVIETPITGNMTHGIMGYSRARDALTRLAEIETGAYAVLKTEDINDRTTYVYNRMVVQYPIAIKSPGSFYCLIPWKENQVSETFVIKDMGEFRLFQRGLDFLDEYISIATIFS